MFIKKVIISLIILFLYQFPCYCNDKGNISASREQAKVQFDTGKQDYYDKGNYLNAQDYFMKAIEYYPNEIEYHRFLIDCMVVKDKSPESFDKIIKFYQTQIGINFLPWSENRSSLYYGLGRCYLKTSKPDKQKATEYFDKSLKINPRNDFARDILKIAKHQKLTVKVPNRTLYKDYMTYGTGGLIIFGILMFFGPVRSYIKSRQPKFTGLLFLFNPGGEKIEDQLLERYKRVDNITISVGSDLKCGIVIPTAQPLHALLKAEKLVYQYRVNMIPQGGAKLFLITKERDQKGNETGVSFTVPFSGGILYDSDVIKFGDYFFQYINSTIPKRSQEEILLMMPGLHPTAMVQKPDEEQQPLSMSDDTSMQSLPDGYDKEKDLKEKILARRKEDSEEKAEDLGVPAFSGSFFFSQDKEKEIKDAIARAKARIQLAKEKVEEKPVVQEDEEEEYEQYMSIVGVTSVQAGALTGIREYEEYDDEEEYEEVIPSKSTKITPSEVEKITLPEVEKITPVKPEEITTASEEKITEVIENKAEKSSEDEQEKIKKESIRDAIMKVKTRLKKDEDKEDDTSEEEEVMALGMGFGEDDEDTEEEVKKIKKKKVVKVKKVVKAVPDRVVDKKEVTEGTIPEKKKTGTIKKKVSKTKNDTSRGIEEKVKAIEETMSRSLEEKFIKLDKEKMIKKIIKKKIES